MPDCPPPLLRFSLPQVKKRPMKLHRLYRAIAVALVVSGARGDAPSLEEIAQAAAKELDYAAMTLSELKVLLRPAEKLSAHRLPCTDITRARKFRQYCVQRCSAGMPDSG